jgi:hypothetical protein
MDTGNNELKKALRTIDLPAAEIATRYAIRYNLPQIADRLSYNYKAGFSTIRSLQRIYVDIFDLDTKRFIDFYEGLNDKDDVPHYEDAIAMATIIIGIIAIVASPIIGVEYGKWRNREKPNIQKVLYLFTYLINAYGLRDMHYRKIISLGSFKELTTFLKMMNKEPRVRLR